MMVEVVIVVVVMVSGDGNSKNNHNNNNASTRTKLDQQEMHPYQQPRTTPITCPDNERGLETDHLSHLDDTHETKHASPSPSSSDSSTWAVRPGAPSTGQRQVEGYWPDSPAR